MWQIIKNLQRAVICLSIFFYAPAIEATTKALSSGEQVSISLWTFGIGEKVETRWGHNALHVYNASQGIDRLYNMGTYDWRQPNFLINFVKGILNYRLSISSSGSSLGYYRAEERSITINKLLLNEQQRSTLLNRLAWQAKPENVQYPYQYFFSNCSTKLRDFIDEALQGQLKEKHTNKLTPHTFRYHVRQRLNNVPLIGSSLDTLLNSRIDRRISEWEAMFLPVNLQKAVQSYVIKQSDQHAQPQYLATADEKLLQFTHISKTRWYHGYGIIVFFPLLLLLVALRLKKRNRLLATNRVLGLILVLWGHYAAFVGSVLTGMWAWSLHLDTHHNANLFLLWPIDCLFIVIGVFLLFQGRAPTLLEKCARSMALCHVVAVFACAVLYATNFIEQNINYSLAFYGSFSLLLYGFTYVQLQKSQRK